MKRLDSSQIIILALLGVGSFLPTLLAAILVHAYRASLYLGRWPYYGHPDPKDLPAGFHPPSQILAFLIPAATWGMSALLPGCLILKRVRRRQWLNAALGVVMLVWTASCIVAAVDPGGIIEWILD